jgi:hypothetical protein
MEIRGVRRSMLAEMASDHERARLWPDLIRMYADYATYQERTEREIPVVLLSALPQA